MLERLGLSCLNAKTYDHAISLLEENYSRLKFIMIDCDLANDIGFET